MFCDIWEEKESKSNVKIVSDIIPTQLASLFKIDSEPSVIIPVHSSVFRYFKMMEVVQEKLTYFQLRCCSNQIGYTYTSDDRGGRGDIQTVVQLYQSKNNNNKNIVSSWECFPIQPPAFHLIINIRPKCFLVLFASKNIIQRNMKWRRSKASHRWCSSVANIENIFCQRQERYKILTYICCIETLLKNEENF